MADASPFVEILKIGLSALTGGIAGYFTSRRTERDAHIKELLDEIDDVVDLAEDYWCNDYTHDDIERWARKIRAGLKDVGSINVRIGRRHVTYRFQGQKQLIEFRKAISDGNFDVKGRAPEFDRIERIRGATRDLKNAVSDCKCSVFSLPVTVFTRPKPPKKVKPRQ